MLQIVKLSSHIYILSTFTQRIALFWCMITKLLIKKTFSGLLVFLFLHGFVLDINFFGRLIRWFGLRSSVFPWNVFVGLRYLYTICWSSISKLKTFFKLHLTVYIQKSQFFGCPKEQIFISSFCCWLFKDMDKRKS